MAFAMCLVIVTGGISFYQGGFSLPWLLLILIAIMTGPITRRSLLTLLAGGAIALILGTAIERNRLRRYERELVWPWSQLK